MQAFKQANLGPISVNTALIKKPCGLFQVTSGECDGPYDADLKCCDMFCEPRPRVLEGSECNPFKEPAIHNNDSTRKAMEAAKQPQEVRPKPALPPKPSATVVAPPLPAASSATDLSEKDRDSEPPPEGSVDQSPTYSESVQSGTAGGAGTASTGTPAYVRWAESVQYLLDDTDGFQLFKQYLVQQCLDHLLMF